MKNLTALFLSCVLAASAYAAVIPGQSDHEDSAVMERTQAGGARAVWMSPPLAILTVAVFP